jgi:pSer/pThr/pTyr-binding forkhead associated (FHA) protein
VARIILTRNEKIVRELEISKDRITIGRRAHNDVVIDHIAVSGEHAVILLRDEDVLLEDLDSTNGTRVNGQPVQRHFLQKNDVIDLAGYRLRFVADAARVEPVAITNRHAARIRMLDGACAGREIGLVKTMTTVGKPGKQVAVITQNRQSYCLTHVEGESHPFINDIPAVARAHPLVHGDVIRLAGARMKFLQG